MGRSISGLRLLHRDTCWSEINGTGSESFFCDSFEEDVEHLYCAVQV
jgi:hypothetical protein